MASFSDDFSGTLGNWTQVSGTADITTGLMRLTLGGFANHWIIHNSSLDGVNGYIKVTSPPGNSQFPQVPFRYTNGSSPFYFLELTVSSGGWEWVHRSAAGGTSTSLATGSDGGPTGEDVTYGITWTGTGAATTIRIWRDPTGDAPDSATSWGGDTTPNVTFSDPGGNAVDTGNQLGLGGQSGSANAMFWDDFFSGDLAGAVIPRGRRRPDGSLGLGLGMEL